MILKADHNKYYHGVLTAFSMVMRSIHFRSFNIHGTVKDNGESMLVLCNHFSWWDGFIVAEVNRRRWQRRFHVMMLEEELEKRKFLQKVGAFSVRRNSRDALESLHYAANILKSPENMVLIFPQGGIESSYKQTFSFEKGIGRIVKSLKTDTQIIFSAALVDYFSKVRPQVDVYITKYTSEAQPSTDQIEEAYNTFFASAVESQREQVV